MAASRVGTAGNAGWGQRVFVATVQERWGERLTVAPSGNGAVGLVPVAVRPCSGHPGSLHSLLLAEQGLAGTCSAQQPHAEVSVTSTTAKAARQARRRWARGPHARGPQAPAPSALRPPGHYFSLHASWAGACPAASPPRGQSHCASVSNGRSPERRWGRGPPARGCSCRDRPRRRLLRPAACVAAVRACRCSAGGHLSGSTASRDGQSS